jgi:DnaJ-class molecular chaperone
MIMKLNALDIEKARIILELGEKATLKEVKAAFRTQTKKWHPDKCKKKEQKTCHEKMKAINRAYKTIMKYIEEYNYSFAGEKITEEDLEERWKKRFGKDPLWGEGWE